MGAYEAIKDAAKLAQKADNVELYERLLDAQREALEMQEELRAVRREIEELRRQEELEEGLDFDEGIYWLDGEDGERGGPYCQLCWDRDRDLIRLQDYGKGRFYCFGCENTVYHDAATDEDGDPLVWRGR